jgi:hypothetical protein
MFLMPFTTLTCGGAKLITMNGVQLATGTTMESPDAFTGRKKIEKIKPEPLAGVAAVFAVLALALAFLGGKPGKVATAIAAAVCALSLFAMKLKVDQDAIRQGQGMLGVQWEFGFWLAILASIAVIALSFIPERPSPNQSA